MTALTKLPAKTSAKKPTNKTPAKPKRQFKYPVKSSDTLRKSTPLVVPAPPTAPTVFYTPRAWEIIRFLIDYNEEEVGWLGTVDQLDDGNLLIDEIFVPKQRVHGTETEIDTDDYHRLCNELLDTDRYADSKGRPRLIYWGHSHVDMGVSPSAQDEEQVAEYLEEVPLFIRGIYNKKGASKVDVYDVNANLIHQCVDERIQHNALSPEDRAELKALVDRNVLPARDNWSDLRNWNDQWQGYRSLFDEDDDFLPGNGSQTIRDCFAVGYPPAYVVNYTPAISAFDEERLREELEGLGVAPDVEEWSLYTADPEDPRLTDLSDLEIIYYGTVLGDDWLDAIMPWHQREEADNDAPKLAS